MTDPDASERERILGSAPVFRSGDATLSRVYRHRWESFVGNLVRTEHGWLVTEFRQPGPGRAHGTVNAAAAHHIREGRWLGRVDVIADYIRYWYAAPEAEPHRYTEWIAAAALDYASLHGGPSDLVPLLPSMVDVFRTWERDSRHPSGLYWAHDLADAMEFSISGDGIRPSINSYQWANARAIAQIARHGGDTATAAEFEHIADQLEVLIRGRLWDPDLGLFVTLPMSKPGEDAYLATAGAERRMPAEERDSAVPDAREIDPERRVRELTGYLPWYVGIPGADIDPARAVAELVDPDGFGGRHGLTTAERRHPRYRFPVATTSPRFLCRWNGPAWPFATAQTLTALARIAREHPGHGYDEVFLRLLLQYAASHIEPDGSYWLDEDLDPDTGQWLTRDWRRVHQPERASIGRDYQHSTFADLVLSGLLGLGVENGVIVCDPLPAVAALGWFDVDGLRLAGRELAVDWSESTGLRLRGEGVLAERATLGRLQVPAVSRA